MKRFYRFSALLLACVLTVCLAFSSCKKEENALQITFASADGYEKTDAAKFLFGSEANDKSFEKYWSLVNGNTTPTQGTFAWWIYNFATDMSDKKVGAVKLSNDTQRALAVFDEKTSTIELLARVGNGDGKIVIDGLDNLSIGSQGEVHVLVESINNDGKVTPIGSPEHEKNYVDEISSGRLVVNIDKAHDTEYYHIVITSAGIFQIDETDSSATFERISFNENKLDLKAKSNASYAFKFAYKSDKDAKAKIFVDESELQSVDIFKSDVNESAYAVLDLEKGTHEIEIVADGAKLECSYADFSFLAEQGEELPKRMFNSYFSDEDENAGTKTFYLVVPKQGEYNVSAFYTYEVGGEVELDVNGSKVKIDMTKMEESRFDFNLKKGVNKITVKLSDDYTFSKVSAYTYSE